MRRGRPLSGRKRYPGGAVMPAPKAGPNEMLLEKRRLLAADPTMAENPLDAAFANGWLTEAEHRAGRSYAIVHRRADLGAPRDVVARLGEARSETAEELRGLGIRDMTIFEITALWDEVFDEVAGASDDERERQTEAAMARLRILNAAMSAEERAEVHLVCVLESWPQWFIHRCAGRAIRARAERRPLTVEETGRVEQLFSSRWERKRDLLVAGLRTVGATLAEIAPRRGGPHPARPAKAGPVGSRVIEVTEYVDTEGEHVLTVERRGRR